MSEENATPSGDPAGQPPVADDQSQKNVSYESHRQLLREKKNTQERAANLERELNDLRASNKQIEDDKLVEQNKYKELYDARNLEVASLNTKLQESSSRWDDAIKLDAFNGALGEKKIDRKYLGFIDTTNILIDPETGRVDETTAQREVERITREFPEIVRQGRTQSNPTPAPQGVAPGNQSTMTLAEKRNLASRLITDKMSSGMNVR